MPDLADMIAEIQSKDARKGSQPTPHPGSASNLKQTAKSRQSEVRPKRAATSTSEGPKRGRNFMLSPDVYALLNQIRFKEDRSLSEIVDSAIREYAENHGYHTE